MTQVKLVQEQAVWEPAEEEKSVEMFEDSSIVCFKKEESEEVEIKAELPEFPFFPLFRVSVKSEHQQPDSSLLHETVKEETREDLEGAEKLPETEKHSEKPPDVDWTQSTERCTPQPHSVVNKQLQGPADIEHVDADRSDAGAKSYTCSHCGKTFITTSKLRYHERIHKGERPFKCTVCKKGFLLKHDLKRHMGTHTGEKPFKCTVCDKRFIVKCQLNYHMRSHTEEKPFKCSVCEKGFAGKQQLKRHMSTHTGEKPFKCIVCDKCFIEKCQLSHHMKSHTEEKPFKCSVCAKYFPQRSRLNTHMSLHIGKSFKCTVCQKCFLTKHHLDVHMTTHSRMTYKCPVCDKSFVQKRILNQHKRTHPGVKPFKSVVYFTQVQSLNKQLRLGLPKGPFRCSTCSDVFSRNIYLQQHMKVHSREKQL